MQPSAAGGVDEPQSWSPTIRPTFSVIVPTYRRKAMLLQALESIRAQTCPDFECIVVSDGPDPDLTEGDLPADMRFRLLHLPKNCGAGAARNRGAEVARGREFVFCDDDDLFEPDRLAIVQQVLAAAEIKLCSASYIGEPDRAPRDGLARVDGHLLSSTTPHLGSLTVSAASFVPFDERLRTCEDVDWWIRQQGRTVIFIPKVGYRVRRHGGVRHRSGIEQRILDSHALLDAHSSFFCAHRKAAAFRWRRIGLMHAALGERSKAASALVQSVRLWPSLRTIRNLVVLASPVVWSRKGR